MSYINYTLLYEKNLSDNDFHILQKIFQKDTILLKPFLSEFKRLEELELISYLKGKENTAEGVRISLKGKTLLDQLSQMNYSDDIGKLVDSVIQLYEVHNVETGKKAEIINKATWFVQETGLNVDKIYELIENYITYMKENNKEYIIHLTNLFWKPKSVFSVHKNLSESFLYDMFCKKYKIDPTKSIKVNNVKIKWIKQISSLKTPKTLPKELTLTGSVKTDNELIDKFNNILIEELKNLNK